MPLTVAPVTLLLWFKVPVETLRPVPGSITPLVDAVASGKSSETSARNVGSASTPVVGPAKTELAT